MPATTGRRPAIISGFGPYLATSLGARRDVPNSAAVMGTKDNPAFKGLKPSTSWTNWVRKKNEPNMPATRSSRAT